MPRSTSQPISYLVVAALVVIVFAVVACSRSTPPPATPTPERATETPVTVADTPVPVAPEATPAAEPTRVPGGEQAEFEGIRLSLDEAIATSATAEMVEMTQEEGGPWWAAEPQHVVFALEGYPLEETFHEPRIIVYPVRAFESMNEYAADQITQLQNLLTEEPTESEDNLPFLPLFNAGQIIHARVEYLDFQNGSGVRFLTHYSQAAGPINNNELFYTFQGLTDDSEYYVAAILPVSHPDLPADFMDTPEDFPEPGNAPEEFQADYQAYLDKIVQQLNAAEPGSFNPDLPALDAMIRSLSVDADFAEAAAAAAPTRPPGEAPANVVNSFYTWLLNYAETTGNPLADRAYRDSEQLSQELIQEVDAELDAMELGGADPFLCAQDIPGQLDVGDAAVTGDEARVVVHEIWNPGTDAEQARDVTVWLEQTDAEWQIVAIGCPRPINETPSGTVEAFYNWYLDYIGEPRTEEMRNPLVDRAYRRSAYLTRDFVAEVDATLAGFERGGFDPFLQAQDIPSSFEVSEAEIEGDSATVQVTTSFPGHVLNVRLIRQGDEWLIDEIGRLEPGAAVESGPAGTLAGWQVFESANYGFGLAHPPDWTWVELNLDVPGRPPNDPLVRVVQFMPREWLEEVTAPGPPDPERPARVAPLSVQVSIGSLEEYRQTYVEPDATQVLEINGLPVTVEQEIADGVRVIRYVFQHPQDDLLRVTLIDYISGFPERLAGNEQVAETVDAIVNTFEWAP